VYNGVYVVTGPIYDEYRETLSSRSRVEIPDAFYKILVDAEPGSIRLLPFIIPQTVSGKEPLVEFLTSVDEIEQATGLDFFWALSDSQENRLEADKPSSLWENP
jgi:endonuclease G